MHKPEALFFVLIFAGGFVWILLKNYSFRELSRQEEPNECPRFLAVMYLAISFGLVWFGIGGLLANGISILVPGRFDPNDLNKAARIQMHGAAAMLMCLASLCAATAITSNLLKRRRRLLRRSFGLLSVILFGVSLSWWLYQNVKE
jgi:uncharacterized membrane protein YfcA